MSAPQSKAITAPNVRAGVIRSKANRTPFVQPIGKPVNARMAVGNRLIAIHTPAARPPGAVGFYWDK